MKKDASRIIADLHSQAGGLSTENTFLESTSARSSLITGLSMKENVAANGPNRNSFLNQSYIRNGPVEHRKCIVALLQESNWKRRNSAWEEVFGVLHSPHLRSD